MAALYPLLRGAALRAGSLLPPRNASDEVRFFYGHAMTARDLPRFRRTLRMLRERFEFVGMRDAVALARASDAPVGRYLAFSFDDGFTDCHDFIAPVLDEFGARACFFVPSRFIESDEEYRSWFVRERLRTDPSKRPMTWSMVRALADAGFEIGAHTADHVDLGACAPDGAVAQVLASKHAVEERLARPCEWFAWPYGLADNFPAALVPAVRPHFAGIFSAMRSRSVFSYGGAVINRDHFEPGWPTAHVRYFASRRVTRAAA